MDSIEKLRKELDVCGCDQDECLCCEVPRKVRDVLDEIEREIAERYMELPVDADGVPIKPGDVMMDYKTPRNVVAVAPDSFMMDGYETDSFYRPGLAKNHRHVKPDPVKDLLKEFEVIVRERGACFSDFDEYAARIREAVEK